MFEKLIHALPIAATTLHSKEYPLLYFFLSQGMHTILVAGILYTDTAIARSQDMICAT